MKVLILLSTLCFLVSCASTHQEEGRSIASVEPGPKAMRTISEIEDPDSLPSNFYDRDPQEE